jgi:hypothetical protein
MDSSTKTNAAASIQRCRCRPETSSLEKWVEDGEILLSSDVLSAISVIGDPRPRAKLLSDPLA